MLAWDAYTRDVIAAGVHLGGEGSTEQARPPP